MRGARTILELLRERGKKWLPLEHMYRLLYNPGLFLITCARIYLNQRAMTKGTKRGNHRRHSFDKNSAIIDELKHERYRWSPARPVEEWYETAVGCSIRSDKLTQEVIRLLLNANLDP